jgi:hypothetical protein
VSLTSLERASRYASYVNTLNLEGDWDGSLSGHHDIVLAFATSKARVFTSLEALTLRFSYDRMVLDGEDRSFVEVWPRLNLFLHAITAYAKKVAVEFHRYDSCLPFDLVISRMRQTCRKITAFAIAIPDGRSSLQSFVNSDCDFLRDLDNLFLKNVHLNGSNLSVIASLPRLRHLSIHDFREIYPIFPLYSKKQFRGFQNVEALALRTTTELMYIILDSLPDDSPIGELDLYMLGDGTDPTICPPFPTDFRPSQLAKLIFNAGECDDLVIFSNFRGSLPKFPALRDLRVTGNIALSGSTSQWAEAFQSSRMLSSLSLAPLATDWTLGPRPDVTLIGEIAEHCPQLTSVAGSFDLDPVRADGAKISSKCPHLKVIDLGTSSHLNPPNEVQHRSRWISTIVGYLSSLSKQELSISLDPTLRQPWEEPEMDEDAILRQERERLDLINVFDRCVDTTNALKRRGLLGDAD